MQVYADVAALLTCEGASGVGLEYNKALVQKAIDKVAEVQLEAQVISTETSPCSQ